MSAQIYVGGSGEYQVIIPNQGVIQKTKEQCSPIDPETHLTLSPHPYFQNYDISHGHDPPLFARQSDSVFMSTRENHFKTQAQISASKSLKFECDICHQLFSEQFKFFEHLKGHYEKGLPEQIQVDKSSGKPCQNLGTDGDSQESNTVQKFDICQTVVDKKEVQERTAGVVLNSPPIPKPTELELPPPPPPPIYEKSQSTTSQVSTDAGKDKPPANKSSKRKKGEKSKLSCQRCKRTFRKVENFQLHTSCCQQIPNDEIPETAKAKGSASKQKKLSQRTGNDDGSDVGRANITQTERVEIPRKTTKKSVKSPPKQPRIPDDTKSNDDHDHDIGDGEFHVGFDDDELDEEQTEMMYLDSNICPSCDEMCESKANLEEHIRNLHPEVLAIDAGDGKTSKKKKGAAKKPDVLKCQQCHRVFNHRNSLVYHIRSHTGIRPYKCEVCNKRFFATSALKVHHRLHSGEKPFNCVQCGRNFRQWGDLKYHKISIHSDIRQYQCEFCGKDFARNYSLIVHRRIHTGERNYKCEFCSKCFRAASYLQNHRRIHTGEKPHACTICSKPFRVRSDMKRHMASHSRDIKVAQVSIVNAIPVTITSTPVSVVSSIGTSVLQHVPILPKQSPQNVVNAADVASTSIIHREANPQDTFKTALCVPIPIVSQATSPTTTVITGETINISLSDGGVHHHHTAEILQNGVTALQTGPEGMTIYGEYQETELITTDGARTGTVVLLPLGHHHYLQN
ncbi:unnamed protein product [Orchesella dallaii]|uniref:C2H2-type domain-containing protein n=1 Tax=Orchesella dallaii TaxID=48710 RepID=A0ABP1R8N3_9HEXA